MHFRPAHRMAALAGATALALAGVSGTGDAAAAGKAERRAWSTTSVYVQGDSLTVGTATALRAALGRRIGALGVDAAVGRHTETGLARLRQDPRARRADIWVVALGTNDAPVPSVVADQVRRSMRMAGRTRPVVWLTLRRPGDYGRVNRMLRAMDHRDEQLHVLDWARTTHHRRGILAGDGVHATSLGYRIRAAMIAEAALRIAAQQSGQVSSG